MAELEPKETTKLAYVAAKKWYALTTSNKATGSARGDAYDAWWVMRRHLAEEHIKCFAAAWAAYLRKVDERVGGKK